MSTPEDSQLRQEQQRGAVREYRPTVTERMAALERVEWLERARLDALLIAEQEAS